MPKPPVRSQILSATSGADNSVTIVYFEGSAFVKLVVDESGIELAAELWDGCDAAVSSRLAYPEVRAALAAAGRAGRLKTTGCVAPSRPGRTFGRHPERSNSRMLLPRRRAISPGVIRCAGLMPCTWRAFSRSVVMASCSRCGTVVCAKALRRREFEWCQRGRDHWLSSVRLPPATPATQKMLCHRRKWLDPLMAFSRSVRVGDQRSH